MQLYSYFRSSAAYRVRIALNLKGLPYEYLAVHLLKDGGQQFSADYRKVNPTALVPTLVDGDAVIGQSLAIIEYLEETHPQAPLLPADAIGRARVNAICSHVHASCLWYLRKASIWVATGPLLPEGLSRKSSS